MYVIHMIIKIIIEKENIPKKEEKLGTLNIT